MKIFIKKLFFFSFCFSFSNKRQKRKKMDAPLSSWSFVLKICFFFLVRFASRLFRSIQLIKCQMKCHTHTEQLLRIGIFVVITYKKYNLKLKSFIFVTSLFLYTFKHLRFVIEIKTDYNFNSYKSLVSFLFVNLW